MDRIRLGLVGCGGMGTRHLYGLRELAPTPFDNVELCAQCDIRRDNAELAAAWPENSWASACGSSPIWKRCAARCLLSMPWTW